MFKFAQCPPRVVILTLLLLFVDCAAAQCTVTGSRISVGDPLYVGMPADHCGTATEPKQLWLNNMDTGVRSIGRCDNAHPLVFNVSQHGIAAGAQSNESWSTLLHRPLANFGANFQRDVAVTVRDASGDEIASCKSSLEIVTHSRLWLALAILGLVVFGTVKAAALSDLMRDSGAPPASGTRPYSLARFQMLMWSGLVLIAYLLIWLITLELPEIPGSALALMGIAGATALGSASVDKSRDAPLQPSQGFWRDIMTDAHGVTLYRLQHFVWTVLFGFVFAFETYTNLKMPLFDESVLLLMGLSAGVYVGFKVPETHTPGDAEGQPDGADIGPKSAYTPS